MRVEVVLGGVGDRAGEGIEIAEPDRRARLRQQAGRGQVGRERGAGAGGPGHEPAAGHPPRRRAGFRHVVLPPRPHFVAGPHCFCAQCRPGPRSAQSRLPRTMSRLRRLRARPRRRCRRLLQGSNVGSFPQNRRGAIAPPPRRTRGWRICAATARAAHSRRWRRAARPHAHRRRRRTCCRHITRCRRGARAARA